MKDYKKLSMDAYNEKAADYENTFDGKFTSRFKKQLIEVVKINSNDKLLDVACGTGELLNQFKQLYKFEAFGIDISENMIKTAKSKHPDISFQTGDSESMPFDDGFFNVITVCASFHHFPNPQQFINEASRLLCKGGSLYIAEICLPPVIKQISNAFVPLYKSGDVKIYSTKEITKMLNLASMTDIKAEKKGHIQIVMSQKQ